MGQERQHRLLLLEVVQKEQAVERTHAENLMRGESRRRCVIHRLIDLLSKSESDVRGRPRLETHSLPSASLAANCDGGSLCPGPRLGLFIWPSSNSV
jgi:hypothetical protein